MFGPPPRFKLTNDLDKPKSIKEMPKYICKQIGGFFSRYAYIFKLVWETNPLILFAMALFSAFPSCLGSSLDALWDCKFLKNWCLYQDVPWGIRLEGKATEGLSHGGRREALAGRRGCWRRWISTGWKAKIELIPWGSSKIPISGSIKHRLEDLGVLAWMFSTVSFSLTCQDPGKGEKGLEAVRTG